MINSKTIGASGDKLAEVQTAGASLKGLSISAGAADTVATELSGTGLFLVTDSTNEDSAVIAVHAAGGTSTPTKLSGAASIAVAKDTASKLNIYFEGGVLKVQNNLAAEVEVSIKFYS